MDILAPLFQFKSQSPERFTYFYEKVGDLLLDFTVHEAYNQSDYYRRSFPELSEHDFIDKEKLKDFPLVFRKQVEDAGRSICSKAVDYGFSSYTGGTTTSNPLIIDRSIQEQDFIYNFFLKLNKDYKSEVKLVLCPLVIPVHGNVLQVPTRNISLFPVAITQESSLNQAIALLKRSFRINGEEKVISCISSSIDSIVKLTAFIMHAGVNGIEKNIKQIQTGGCYLTKHVSDWVMDFWKCEIMDCFSCAELFFAAPKCLECGIYHFNSYGIAEVLDIHSNRRIDAGRGRLFLTGLYPFTQMTPLIRYCTGDLVEIKKINCPHGQYGYRFLGRQKNSLILKKEFSDYAFLSGGEVLEVLDGLPDVNVPKMEYFPSCSELMGCNPVFWFENDPLNIIHIELRYSPVFYPERLKEVENIIKARLISNCNWLEELFEKQLISLKFHPPGSYGKESVIHP